MNTLRFFTPLFLCLVLNSHWCSAMDLSAYLPSQASSSSWISLAESNLALPQPPIDSYETESTLPSGTHIQHFFSFFKTKENFMPTQRDVGVGLVASVATFFGLRNYYLGEEERLKATIEAQNASTKEAIKQEGRETRNLMIEGGERIMRTVVQQESETRKNIQRTEQKIVNALEDVTNQSSSENEVLRRMLIGIREDIQDLSVQKQLEASSSTPDAPTQRLLEYRPIAPEISATNTPESVSHSTDTCTATPNDSTQNHADDSHTSNQSQPSATQTPPQSRIGSYLTAIGNFVWRSKQTP